MLYNDVVINISIAATYGPCHLVSQTLNNLILTTLTITGYMIKKVMNSFIVSTMLLHVVYFIESCRICNAVTVAISMYLVLNHEYIRPLL